MYFLDYEKKNARQSSFTFNGSILSQLKQIDVALWSIWRRLTDSVAVTTAFKLETFCVPTRQRLSPTLDFLFRSTPKGLHNCDSSLYRKFDLQVKNDLFFFFLRFLSSQSSAAVTKAE